MGIHKLMSLILEKAKAAIKNINLDALTGRIIACDASTVNLKSNLRLCTNFW